MEVEKVWFCILIIFLLLAPYFIYTEVAGRGVAGVVDWGERTTGMRGFGGLGPVLVLPHRP